ncbi:hypothetical protein BCR33DRAFT_787422 [Rhizoclosmatium globosum]|uniref:Transmembrane protein 188 n=1 Tax=Rhizoclosmatium globosum TaxID=329046 RepID=A0A1Y2C1J9_9FUNG|nr:hypothetical protein BCR33DRAFT_787422 [Rhizoclosmatium globosum]|eukprot:ORY40774.1 hypothetical protein BCR33DRAFT_787422 [Rhizoclosmatium globosum]
MNHPITSAAQGNSLTPPTATLFGNSVSKLVEAQPDAQRKRFKDLLMFEERLRWNASMQQSQRRLWMGILALLSLTLMGSGYFLFSSSSTSTSTATTTLQSSNNLALYVFCLASLLLILFFVLGFYRSRLRDPLRFRPSLNKVLKHYCLELGAKNNDLVFSRKIPVAFADSYSQYRDKLRKL